MSKSRLEYLLDDIEAKTYTYITVEVVAICRNEYNQLLKQSGCNEYETPSLKYLLQDVERRCFSLSYYRVRKAREEYKYLLDKASKLNATKQQQANTTDFLHTNIHQRNTGSSTTIHDHQRSQILNTTRGNTGNVAQNTLFDSNNRPLNHIKDNNWVTPTKDVNSYQYETSSPASRSVQVGNIFPDQVDNYNYGTPNKRQNNTADNGSASKSYENINKYSKNSNHMLEDCLTAVKNQPKRQDTPNNQSQTNLTDNSDSVTVIYHHNNLSADNKMTTTKTLYPGGTVPLNTTTTNSTTLTEMPQSHVRNDDTNQNARQTKYMGQTSAQNQPSRTSHNANIESEEAKLSRSRAASAQLRRNNPNIVDLSDNNRPTKLAEKFSEMYDNEWTEAFECLETRCNIPEKIIINLLLDIVTKAFQFSKTETVRIVKIMENIFDRVLDHGTVGNCNSEAQIKARKSDTSMLEQYLKENASRAVPRIQRDFCEKLQVICKNFYLENVPVSQGSPIFTFANRCVELTWWMCVQDPPIYMETVTLNPEFNATTYRAYTRTGRDIDYYVWPALLLEQGGPVLMKGVAQCK